MRQIYRFGAAGCAVLAALALAFPLIEVTETPWLVLLALGLSGTLTPLAAWLARRVGAIDSPGGRKIHDRPTPLLGGAAIYVAFLVAVLASSGLTRELWGVVLAASLIFAIGFVEDTRGVPATVRLLFQTVAVIILVRSGVVLTFLPPTWWGVAGEWILTFLWVVGITNAFNFLDGLDGLAAGSAIINAFFLGVYAVATEQAGLALLSFSLMGASAGFLPYNYKPHRRDAGGEIFLGDSGSTFLGFTLASLRGDGRLGRRKPQGHDRAGADHGGSDLRHDLDHHYEST